METMEQKIIFIIDEIGVDDKDKGFALMQERFEIKIIKKIREKKLECCRLVHRVNPAPVN